MSQTNVSTKSEVQLTHSPTGGPGGESKRRKEKQRKRNDEKAGGKGE